MSALSQLLPAPTLGQRYSTFDALEKNVQDWAVTGKFHLKSRIRIGYECFCHPSPTYSVQNLKIIEKKKKGTDYFVTVNIAPSRSTYTASILPSSGPKEKNLYIAQ